MLAGFKTIARHTLTFTVVGAILGIPLGALTDNYLSMVGFMAILGAGFGVAIGYGFLPER
jgi:hypothetical protein